jgi:hypothetical protein
LCLFTLTGDSCHDRAASAACLRRTGVPPQRGVGPVPRTQHGPRPPNSRRSTGQSRRRSIWAEDVQRQLELRPPGGSNGYLSRGRLIRLSSRPGTQSWPYALRFCPHLTMSGHDRVYPPRERIKFERFSHLSPPETPGLASSSPISSAFLQHRVAGVDARSSRTLSNSFGSHNTPQAQSHKFDSTQTPAHRSGITVMSACRDGGRAALSLMH